MTNAKGITTSYTYHQLNDRLERIETSGVAVNYQYETDGSLKKIVSPSGTEYHFTYDIFGRPISILLGSRLLSRTTYKNSYSSLVSETEYGNGVTKNYVYDEQDRLISESVNNVVSRTYLYDKRNNLAQTTDYLGNVTTRFYYDLIGRTVEIKSSDGQTLNFVYDQFNRISLSKWTHGSNSFSSEYVFGDTNVEGQKNGLIYGVKLNGTQKIGYQYDELARLKTRTLNTTTPFATEYAYLEGPEYGTTTTMVKRVKNGSDTLEYTYDELGNILSVAKNGTIVEAYTYDALSQLISAVYGGNTYTYTYDNGGNITEVKQNGNTIKSYTYGNTEWKDLLTAFNGQTITYDDIGNPLTYRNGMNFLWQNGRQLASVSQNGTAIATYHYNADGLRISKTVNGITTEYYWQNGTLYGQKTDDESIFYLYDENGSAYGFIYKNSTEQSQYYYEFNLQGDIIGIIDSTGTRVVEYTYGAWGDILSITGLLADTIGQKNPLRYRGYYYDAETGFYYVSSRYYDPEIGRFLNADSALYQNILGYNMFAYCYNNPINYFDPTGESAVSTFWAWLTGGGTIAAAEPTFVGEIILAAGAIVLGTVVVVEKIVTTVKNISSISKTVTNSKSKTKDESATDDNENKDSRLTGEPGEIKQEGSKETLIGPDGRATKERHWTDHGNPKKHSIPHDHDISWNMDGNPVFGPAQNYWDGTIPIFP